MARRASAAALALRFALGSLPLAGCCFSIPDPPYDPAYNRYMTVQFWRDVAVRLDDDAGNAPLLLIVPCNQSDRSVFAGSARIDDAHQLEDLERWKCTELTGDALIDSLAPPDPEQAPNAAYPMGKVIFVVPRDTPRAKAESLTALIPAIARQQVLEISWIWTDFPYARLTSLDAWRDCIRETSDPPPAVEGGR